MTSVRWRRVPRTGFATDYDSHAPACTTVMSPRVVRCRAPKRCLTLLPEPVDRVGFVPDEPFAVLDR